MAEDENGAQHGPDGPGADAPAAPAVAQPGTTPDYDDAGVPSLEYVRERIESRYATSLGAAELAGESPEARSLAEQLDDRDEAARERLEQLRRSVSGEQGS